MKEAKQSCMYWSKKDSDHRQKSKQPTKQATSFWLTKPWQNALALFASIAATVILPHEEWNELQNELHIRRLALITAVPFGFLFTSTKSAWFGPQVYAHWNAFTLTKHPGQWPAADRQYVSKSLASVFSSLTEQQDDSAYSVQNVNASLDGSVFSLLMLQIRPGSSDNFNPLLRTEWNIPSRFKRKKMGILSDRWEWAVDRRVVRFVNY